MEAGDAAIVSDGATDLSEDDATRLRKALRIGESVLLGDVTVDTVNDYLARTRNSTGDQDKYYEINFVLEKVKRWIDLNQRNQHNRTLLHDALLCGCYEWIQLLIVHGADANGDFRSDWPRMPSTIMMEYLLSCQIAARRPLDQMTLCLHCEDGKPMTFTLPMTKLWEISYWRSNAIVRYDSLWVFTPNDNAMAPLMVTEAIARQLLHDHKTEWQSLNDWCSFVVHFIRETTLPPIISARNPILNYREPMYHVSSSVIGRLNANERAVDAVVIVFPYLTMDVVKNWRRRRAQHEEDWPQHETSPQPHETWGIGPGSNFPDNPRCRIYCERTLDEAYYPSLPNDQLEDRNRTQVVQRQYMKENNCGQSEWPILLVPQLWIWKIDDVIVSTYPLHTNQMDFTDDEDYTWKVSRQADVDCRMTQAIWEHVDAFRRPFRDADSGEVIFASALDIFELAVVETLSDVRQYAAERSTQSIDMELERKLIESLADIRSELDMISTVMAQQEEIIDKVINTRTDREAASRKAQVEEVQHAIPDGRSEKKVESHVATLQEYETNICMDGLKATKSCIENYKRRIAKINRDADKVAKTVDDMLILSRTEASIKEAQNGVVIGWAATAFAIITVIFTPLSFMASLMALPVNRFMDHQYIYNGDARAYKSGYLASIFIGAEVASLLVTGAILGVAYWFSPMNRISGKKQGPNRNINTQEKETPCEAKQDPPGTKDLSSNSPKRETKSTSWFAEYLPDSLTRRLRSKKKDEEIGGQEKQKSEV